MTVLIAETCHHEIGGDGSESLIVRNFGFQKKMTCFSTRSVWVGFPGSHSWLGRGKKKMIGAMFDAEACGAVFFSPNQGRTNYLDLPRLQPVTCTHSFHKLCIFVVAFFFFFLDLYISTFDFIVLSWCLTSELTQQNDSIRWLANCLWRSVTVKCTLTWVSGYSRGQREEPFSSNSTPPPTPSPSEGLILRLNVDNFRLWIVHMLH